MNTIIKTNKLSKSFSNEGNLLHVLKNIDLEIYKGDFTVIMGPSGAGKSTLLYSLSGMDKPTPGNIYYDDLDITKLDQNGLALFRRDNAGFVFQSVYLIDSMSVLDNVLCAGLLKNKNKKEVVNEANALLDRVGIGESLRNKFPSQLSGGEAQRVGIARALINNPRVVFVDEPTGSLNSKTGIYVLNTLSDFNKAGQSIVMVTHDITSALRGNRIIYIKDGEICGELKLDKFNLDDTNRKEKLNQFLKEMGW